MALLQQLSASTGLGRALGLRHLGARLGAACSSSPLGSLRQFSSYQQEVDALNAKFVEARDEIEYAMEDAETVYFNESANDAKEMVQQVLDKYDALLNKLTPEERGKLERSMGLKIAQLKAEAAQLDTLHAD